jgi:hypothetical protein
MEWTPPLGPADYIPDWDRYMKADNSWRLPNNHIYYWYDE